MMIRKMMYVVAVIFILSACGTTNEQQTINDPLPPADVSMEKGDFIYRLYTEKDVYDEYGDTAIFAELTYVGPEQSIDIYHAASPFYFTFEERTRNYFIDYAMNEPLITTTLQKGEPLRQKYTFTGGFSDQDDKAYVKFIQEIIEKGFPIGEYIVHGKARFFTVDPAEANETQTYELQADIGFYVQKPVVP